LGGESPGPGNIRVFLQNDIFQLSNIVPATVYSWTVGSAHFSVQPLAIRRVGCSYCVSANPVAMHRQRGPGPPIARQM